jgi:hypothetical protein
MQLFGKEKASGLWLLASGCWLLAMLFYAGSLSAQHTYIRTGGPTDYILDRIELKSGQFANDYFHTTLKSYRRMAIANYVDSLQVDQMNLSKADYFNLA